MSLSSEIIIKPSNSTIYYRIIIVLYLITAVLIFSVNIYWFLKAGFIILLLLFFIQESQQSNPCKNVQELRSVNAVWQMVIKNGPIHRYEKCNVLIHNELFILLRFSNSTENKLVVLFNDQLSKEELRLIHLINALQ